MTNKFRDKAVSLHLILLIDMLMDIYEAKSRKIEL